MKIQPNLDNSEPMALIEPFNRYSVLLCSALFVTQSKLLSLEQLVKQAKLSTSTMKTVITTQQLPKGRPNKKHSTARWKAEHFAATAPATG